MVKRRGQTYLDAPFLYRLGRVIQTWLTAGVLVTTLTAMSEAPLPQATTVLITGSNRGIGLEFTRQYAERGWRVIATCRHPDTAYALQALAHNDPDIIIERLDVTDHGAIDDLADKYRGTAIDVLINNAGISGGLENQQFGEINFSVFKDVYAVNVVGPLKMAEAFADHVAASDQKKIITVSSSQGSIAQTRGLLYIYRSSKTAVNMAMRNLANELAARQIIVGLVAPGATDTDFMKGVPIPLGKPQDRVKGMIEAIDAFTLDTSGSFIDYSGKPLPW